MVANLTVTHRRRRAHRLAVQPDPPRRLERQLPAGETASNLAIVRTGLQTVSLYNASAGSTQMVVHQAGYFIAAAP